MAAMHWRPFGKLVVPCAEKMHAARAGKFQVAEKNLKVAGDIYS